MATRSKLQVTGLIAVLFFGLCPLVAHAALIRTAVGADSYVVVDEVNSLQWADVSHFAGLTFYEVNTEIATMNTSVFSEVSDWHLASASEMQLLFVQMGTVGDARQFNRTSPAGSPPGTYSVDLIGIYDQVNVANTHAGADVRYLSTSADNSTDFQNKYLPGTNYMDDHSYATVGAFVVATRPMQQVPEPGILSLFVFGTIGVLCAGKRNRRKRK